MHFYGFCCEHLLNYEVCRLLLQKLVNCNLVLFFCHSPGNLNIKKHLDIIIHRFHSSTLKCSVPMVK